MPFAVVFVKGPQGRLVYINDGDETEGRTNRHYPVQVGVNTFELKASARGPAVLRRLAVVAQDPPQEVDLTPP
jgi:hypothetical protein